MVTSVHLTPELEHFARSCVENGFFDNINEVVLSALQMFQEKEEHRLRFNAMLDTVRQEAEREGVYEAADVLAEMDRMIEQQSQ
ncbi:MAG: type II toxin-antitoxin system ParD family antitoxin [Magnetococcales bacterium]|nr:type II toxin-antitoxin system ParD family antitoxin [Magnetococcales bacterium]